MKGSFDLCDPCPDLFLLMIAKYLKWFRYFLVFYQYPLLFDTLSSLLICWYWSPFIIVFRLRRFCSNLHMMSHTFWFQCNFYNFSAPATNTLVWVGPKTFHLHAIFFAGENSIVFSSAFMFLCTFPIIHENRGGIMPYSEFPFGNFVVNLTF